MFVTGVFIMKRLILLLSLYLLPFVAFAQSKVTGTVTDENGEPLIGAYIMPKGSKNGVITDLDGHYSIAAPASGKSYVLVFQYLGMASKEVEVKGAQTLNVSLKSENDLEGAVIVGAYGTVQRREPLQADRGTSSLPAPGATVTVRYSDPAMSFRQKLVLQPGNK